jgi:hypothetical protein
MRKLLFIFLLGAALLSAAPAFAGLKSDKLTLTGRICVTVVHSSGSIDQWPPATDSDNDRGTALLAAVAVANNADVFYLSASTFNLQGNVIDLSLGSPSKGISLHGSGMYDTIIYSNGSANTAAVHIGFNSEITDLSIISQNSNYLIPIGTNYSGVWNANYGDVTIRNVYVYGATDGFYFNGGYVRVNLINLRCDSRYDCVNFGSQENPAGATCNIFNSDLRSTYGGTYSTIRAVVVSAGIANIYSSYLQASGGTNLNAGVAAYDPGGGKRSIVNVFSSRINSFGGTNPPYDADLLNYGNDANSVINVGNTVYLSSRTYGTIGFADAQAINNSLGSITPNFQYGFSSTTGTFSGPINVTGVDRSTFTTPVVFQNFIQLDPLTSSAIVALTPSAAGQVYNCSNCSVVPVCISTGTAKGSFSLITSKSTVCS